MHVSRYVTIGLAAATIAAFVLVIGSQSQQRRGGQTEATQTSAVVQPANPVNLNLRLGLKDEEQTPWTGEVKVTGGTLKGINIQKAAINASSEGAKFSVRALKPRANANRPKRQKQLLQPAELQISLDAPPSAIVDIETSRGNISFTLGELAAGEKRLFLEGSADVSREEGSTCLTGSATEDDFPALARAKDGTIWMAYVEYKPGPELVNERIFDGAFEALEPKGIGDQIKLVRFDGKTWHKPLDASDAGLDVWRPTVTTNGQGQICLAWAQKVDGDWEIMSRCYTPGKEGGEGKWSKVNRVTKAPGSDFHAVAATDSAGRVWLAWQAWRGDNYDILVATADEKGMFGPQRTVSNSKKNDWCPTIAAGGKGIVYVAWDTYDKGNYDVQLARFDGKLLDRMPVADSLRFEARPDIACDDAGRVWIAYEEGDQQWGKDFSTQADFRKIGFESNPGFALYINRTVKVKCLVDGQFLQPAGHLEAAFKGNLDRNKSVPQIGFDGNGGLWLLLRHHPQPGGAGETWHSFALRYNGQKWTGPIHLSNSANLLDNRPALAAHGDGLVVVYSGDYRTQTQNRQQDDLFSALLPGSEKAQEPALAEVPEDLPEAVPVVHPDEAADVARMRDYRVQQGGKELLLLRGEFHRHTEYTAHRDGDGLLEDAWRYALDAGNLDWMGDGDHDNGYGHEYMWWQIQKITDLHHNPPHFVAAMTYERSLVYPNGHRNVMMPRRGIRPLPRASLESSETEGTVDTKVLYRYLKFYGGICASHTSGTNMGTDWRDNDPEVEPVVEIYQGHRHNYEHFGAPRSATAETQIGGYQPAGFVWNALEKGYRLGFQSSSDHISTHMSYAIVLAEDTSRQALIDAFKKRHSYAATDNIVLIVRSGDHLMGDVFETADHPQLQIEVHGTSPIAKVHVVRDNKYIYSVEPKGADVKRTFTDTDIKPGDSSYYYVRVDQSDGNLAWASPMWITYKPQE